MVFAGQHKHQVLRQKIWSILHEGKGFAGHAFNLFLILAIIGSLSLLPLEFIPQLQEFHGALAAIEIVISVLFTLEYALRIYAAPDRWKFIFSFYGLVDFFSIAPFYLGFLATDYVRVLRLLRTIRLLKLGEMHAGTTEEEEKTMEKAAGLLPNEHVDYIVRMHPFYLILGSLPSLVATSCAMAVLLFFDMHPATITVAICLILFSLIFLWKTWLDFSYDVIFVTSHRLICQNQYLIGRSINQVNYHAVTNVKPYYPSFLSYFLRYGSIKIETTAAEPGHTELHMVRSHEQAAHIIMEHCSARERRSSHPEPHHYPQTPQNGPPTPPAAASAAA